MREDVFTCDVCEATTTSPQYQGVWTQIQLKPQYGVVRVTRTIDMCPSCQDTVFSYLKSLNMDATKGKENRKTFL